MTAHQRRAVFGSSFVQRRGSVCTDKTAHSSVVHSTDANWKGYIVRHARVPLRSDQQSTENKLESGFNVAVGMKCCCFLRQTHKVSPRRISQERYALDTFSMKNMLFSTIKKKGQREEEGEEGRRWSERLLGCYFSKCNSRFERCRNIIKLRKKNIF